MSDLRDFTGKAEIYGLKKIDSDGDGVNDTLRVTTTSGGAQAISNAEFLAFDDYFFAATGFVFSIDSNGHLIATIDN
jgi:hypothetical protein|tara:strand:+ start:713 stop:943 length:231 start_codon:yes stop_codon:yes gene_type:complete